MRFSPDDVVFRVQLNLERVRTAEDALRTWLPLVGELRPLSMTFEVADPAGLRRGFLADLLLVHRLPEEGVPAGGCALDRLLAAVDALVRRLGLDPADFVADEDGSGGVLTVGDAGGGSPHGARLVLALTGADPLNPEGDEMDYADTGEDLP
ncbi:hypothetical protein [Streptomyces sp. NPDC006267]|uniref:hypothetical protein n=1 Tax=Streptomyces sp. NPDC006267 TaxID=3157173 RepID=UPI0033B947F8